ncbi:MAG: hypothetical protein HQM14_05150 [SAR324 cluster bacterium]|nr:hypothetical protein [SAR324 cluster bacterium]
MMTGTINKIIPCALVGLGCFFWSMTTAHAQFFGFSADGAIAYSANEEGISGSSFGITHPIPFVPNIGGMGFFFERRNKGAEGITLATKVTAATGNLYYNIPVPIFTMSVGAGAGNIITKTDIITNIGRVETIEVSSPIGEGFIRFGLPFFHFFDFHIGYHFVSTGEIKLVEDSETEISGVKEKVDLSGGLTTIGITIAL